MADYDYEYSARDISLVAHSLKVDKETLESWKKIGDDFVQGVQAIVYKNGQLARDRARKAAPRRTGALRSSIYVTSPSKGGMSATKITPQAYSGYFRAISAAVKKNARLGVETDEEYISHVKTQRRKNEKYKFENVTLSNGKTVRALVSAGESTFQEQFAAFPVELYKKDYFYVVIGAAAFYAAYVEYGTSKQSPRPFLGPAAEWAQKQNIEDIKRYAETFMKAKRMKNGS